MYRVQWTRVLLIACAAGLLVVLLRGCLYARAGTGVQQEPPAGEMVIRAVREVAVQVYDHREKRVFEGNLEDYLIGVVAAEMPASFELEALRAQAVAARTYTLKKLSAGGCHSSDADICTRSGCCQAYLSEERMRSSWGAAFEENRAKVAEAVLGTAGEVLLYDGTPIEALYHSASGGYTEDSENVFAAAEPYLRAVESPGETGTSRLSGAVSLSYEAFCEKINAGHPKAGLRADRLDGQIAVLSRTDSGRVMRMRLGNVTLTGKQVRYLVGLDSTMFTVTLTGRTVRFDTKGFGHGVGMSQTGANAMALGGSDYRTILLHYYTGVTIGAYGGE